MNCDRGILVASRLTVPVCLLRIRGELAMGAHRRATDLYAVGLLSGKQDEKSTSIRMRECRRMRDERRA